MEVVEGCLGVEARLALVAHLGEQRRELSCIHGNPSPSSRGHIFRARGHESAGSITPRSLSLLKEHGRDTNTCLLENARRGRDGGPMYVRPFA